MKKVNLLSYFVALALVFSACNKEVRDQFVDEDFGGFGFKTAEAYCPAQWNCDEATDFKSFLKKPGNDKGVPESNKVGDLWIVAEGENLAIYLFASKAITDAGVLWTPTIDGDINTTLQPWVNAGYLIGGGKGPNTDKNISNGKVANQNKAYRANVQGGVKFTIPKSVLAEGGYTWIVYCKVGGTDAWAYGIPNGPSGTVSSVLANLEVSTNNGQYCAVGVAYCDPIIVTLHDRDGNIIYQGQVDCNGKFPCGKEGLLNLGECEEFLGWVDADGNKYACTDVITKSVELVPIIGKIEGCGLPPVEDEVKLTNINWSSSGENDGGMPGIGWITVNGVRYAHNDNYVAPAEFVAADNTWTITEIVVSDVPYKKAYEVKVVFKGILYAGIINVDNPGGNQTVNIPLAKVE